MTHNDYLNLVHGLMLDFIIVVALQFILFVILLLAVVIKD